MPTPDGNMTPREMRNMVLRSEANHDTAALAAAMAGTAENSPEGYVETHEQFHDWSEDHLYAFVDLCGGCDWWASHDDLHEDERGHNGLLCSECRDDMNRDEERHDKGPEGRPEA